MDNQTHICRECSQEFNSEKSLHAHLKAHKISIAGYYQKFYPRTDLLTGEIIEFKNKERYFDSDFLNKNNMKKWLKAQPPEVVKDFCKKILERRIEKKNLKYSPTQVELRSVMSPPVGYYDAIFGDYLGLCISLGLDNRFKRRENKPVNSPVSHIKVDTRENKTLKLKLPIQVETLEFGDYACDNSDCYFERKSLPDFIGTLGQGFDRFSNECERAGYAKKQLVVLVESKIDDALAFNYLPWISKRIKATPEYIFHNVREILQRYPHVQFLFVDGRPESVRIIEKVFSQNISVQEFDLQLYYDLGKL